MIRVTMGTHERRWMEPAEPVSPAAVAVYRNCFETAHASTLEMEYSADERAMFFLDGERIGDGPERGTPHRWYRSHISAEVSAGRHCLTARVTMFGPELRQTAQASIRCGLLVEERSRILTPGWECRLLTGCRFLKPAPDWGTVPRIAIDGGFDWTICDGGGDGWNPVRYFQDSRLLVDADLPPMRFEPVTDYTYENSEVHFREYLCAWAEYEFEGPGTVEIRWYESADPADRPEDDWEGCYQDTFELPAGRVRWRDFWWRSGSAVAIKLEGNAKVTGMRFHKTGYPFRYRVDFRDSDPEKELLLDKARRTLECCAVETYMDCPFYEQLQYIGDSRIEMLCTYLISNDLRLPEKALRQFASGQRRDGILPCRFPSHDQLDRYDSCTISSPIIPGFSLLYPQLVHDFARLRRNDELVCELLPAVRRSLAAAAGHLDGGVLRRMPGWNFMDWLPHWENGTPPFCAEGCGCTLNWFFVRSLRDCADLEKHFGTPGRAAAALELADEVEAAVEGTFFDAARGCFAEDCGHRYFSEHAQVWALLAAGRREVLPALLAGDLDRCGIYFSFYYLEVCRLYGQTEHFKQRMRNYLELAAATAPGMTLPEEFSKWRSHCHAWSSHSLYFKYAVDSFTQPVTERV